MDTVINTDITATDKVSSVAAKIKSSVEDLSKSCADGVKRIAESSGSSNVVLTSVAENARARWEGLADGVGQTVSAAQRAGNLFANVVRDVAGLAGADGLADIARDVGAISSGIGRWRGIAGQIVMLREAAGGLAPIFLRAHEAAARWTASVRASIGPVRSLTGAMGVLRRAGQATCIVFGRALPIAMRAAKVAMVSTLIGAGLLALGEAVAYVYGKITDFIDAGKEATAAADGLAASVEKLGAELAGAPTGEIRRIEAERLAESVEALEVVAKSCGLALDDLLLAEKDFAAGIFNEDDFGADAAGLRRIFELRAQIRSEAAAAEKAAIEKEAAEKRAARIKAEAEELAQMRAHADALRAEIARARLDAAREAADGLRSKIELELCVVGLDNLAAVEREIAALESAVELTEEEKARAEQLLAARQKIAALEASTGAAKNALREKVALMQAELEGNEKLLELKEKLHEAEIREQFIKAGYSTDEAEAAVLRYRDLEKAVEAKRAAEKQAEKDAAAQETLAREAEELEILRAKIAGNDALAASLERERAVREKIAELTARGVAADEARAIASERVALDALRREKSSSSSAKETKRGAGNVAVPPARSEAERQALSAAYRAARGAGRTHEQSIAAALTQVRGGIGAGTGVAGRAAAAGMGVVPAAGESVLSAVREIRDHTRGILDVLRGGAGTQKVVVNPVLG